MRNHNCVLRIAVAAILGGTTSASASTIINFSSLTQPGTNPYSEGVSYTQQGFTFASGSSLDVWEASSTNLPGLSTANTSLFQFYADATTTLTDAGNAAFTLNSIDLAPLIAGSTGTFDVTFTGTFADSSTVSQMVSVNNALGLQTFDLSGFTNIVSVSFEQGTNIGFFAQQDTAFQFDNLVINSSPTTVPEPRSLPFLAITGFALIGFAVYQKRNRYRTSA